MAGVHLTTDGCAKDACEGCEDVGVEGSGAPLPVFRELPSMSINADAGGAADAGTCGHSHGDMAVYGGALGAAGQDVLAMLKSDQIYAPKFGVLPTPPVSNAVPDNAETCELDGIARKFGVLPTPPVSASSLAGVAAATTLSHDMDADSHERHPLPDFGALPPLPPPSK